MKKTFLKFAYVGAIALTGMMGFSACQSDSAEEVNPNYDAATNAVKTEFAFNISSNAKQKMTGPATQQDGSFLGMNTMWLYCLAENPTAASTFLSSGQINLGSLAASELSAQSSKIYSMYLPVGTKNFLFYGSQAAYDAEGKHDNGQLTKTFPEATKKYDDKETVNEITFALKPIVEVANTDLVSAGNTLKGYLNHILEAKGSNNMTWIGTQWYLTPANGTAAERIDFKEIASLYFAFVKDMNYRQLSGYDTKRSVQDLYNSIVRVNNKSTNADVKAVAVAVKTAIEANFTATETTPGSGVYTLAYTTTDANITNFPSEQGLPAGAAVVTTEPKAVSAIDANTFTPFDKFTLNLAGENSLGQSIATPTDEITYPSELTYFTNSKAVTATGAHAASDYPKTVENWDNIEDENWAGASGTNKTDWRFPGEVTAATTAAAIRQNIKYGAAQLVSTVKITPKTGDKLIDNAKEITITNDADYDLLEDKEDQEIDYTDNLFTWKGILIGGQPAQSDWQFLPKSGTTMSRVVYDNVINDNTITKTASEPTYTLVMDNFISGTPIPTQDPVNIALEIVNNGDDFYGADGLIPAGATFYLVGQINPAQTGLPDINWTGTYDGNNNTIAHPGRGTKRVFIQDFKTMVNFNISEDGLKKAYSSIPDLRSTKLLFGLSVDLTWKNGLTFNVEI